MQISQVPTVAVDHLVTKFRPSPRSVVVPSEPIELPSHEFVPASHSYHPQLLRSQLADGMLMKSVAYKFT